MRLLNTLVFVAGTVATIAFVPQAANAQRVCNKVCSEGVCKERCVETESRGTEGRGDRRDERREERRGDERRDERREERRPGLELRVPGVGGVEIGR